jgi:hypothetical protein
MDNIWRTIFWQQLGASIDMLENALLACPEECWGDYSEQPEYWYLVYHTLFWLGLYLSGSFQGFSPPPPFTLDELDPAGLFPERVYAKDELQAYLRHCRKKCQTTIKALTDKKIHTQCVFGWGKVSFSELLLYNMRHVQHHAAQLNLILRQKIHSAPDWIAKAKCNPSNE